MTPQFRILKKPRGYIVEVQVKSLFRKKWIPFIKSAGLDCAWHHSTYDYAMSSLLYEIEIQTMKNNNFKNK